MKPGRRRLCTRVLTIIIILSAVALSLNNITKLAYPMHYEEQVYRYAGEYGVDPLLVFSIIRAESKFFPYANSTSGAKGLMQIMDITFEHASSEVEFSEGSLYDPDVNVKAGCWYISRLSEEFEDESLVIAAYNAGPANVKKWLSEEAYSDGEGGLDSIPYPETSAYVERVLENHSKYKKIYKR
ncbi:hypothetical protein EAL2_c11370 [Peptoclostridium acidaminophilum DSM 3953]|uniref:Transglycosylase SLT domain-containing protein n=1 Tax=Peptoclostridium acidaminophilum DSM 3953 TaxID=1286171 RepID=W8T3T9_PEPAC|nr:lytic transglycosylase domain-containing protein [Peptoclostridium acidaminophilum]AHM56434.1 hypothetical protein EAL2_c11370 [Peptoclostridium acidaminophilum DSM 3953]